MLGKSLELFKALCHEFVKYFKIRKHLLEDLIVFFYEKAKHQKIGVFYFKWGNTKKRGGWIK